MDITVTKVGESDVWNLTDLLGRSMGTVVEKPKGNFKILPDGGAVETMGSIGRETCPSLDAALVRIETQTRGVCRLAPEMVSTESTADRSGSE